MKNLKEKQQELKDKRNFIKILNIQDKHNKEYFNTDGCGLEIEFGVVYESSCRVYIETGLKKIKAFVGDRGKFVIDDTIGKFLNVEIVLNPYLPDELEPIFTGIMDILNFYENFVFDENCGVHANFRADEVVKQRFYTILSAGRYDSDRFSHSKFKADFNTTIQKNDGTIRSYDEYLEYQNRVGAKYCGINFLKSNLIEVRTLNFDWEDVAFFYAVYEDAKNCSSV